MSKSVELYNSLDGCIVNRDKLNSIVEIAKNEEQFQIVEKLEFVLSSYENEEFEISLGEKTTEIVPKSMLNGLDFEQYNASESHGLGKAVSPSDIYQMITNKMLEMIKEASGKNYVKKWSGKTYGQGYLIPFNFDTKKRYRGVNVFLLTSYEPLENPFYMTFKQIEAHKGTLKKGAKGSPVVYFTYLYKITDKEKNIDFGSYDYEKAKKFAKENGYDTEKIKKLPILKYYNVFNGKDIEGIDFDLDNFKIGYIEKQLPTSETLPIPEGIINNYPAPAPPLKHGGDRAFYSPSADYIQMPNIVDFDTVQDYYRTLFHEFSHSTGHSKRLARDFSGRFGSKAYAFEELVAEWGATFLSAEAGIIFHTDKNHAEYIKNWNGVLTHIKDDNRFIMRACTKAQELADFVLQFDKNGDAKYLKDLKKVNKTEKSRIDKKKFPLKIIYDEIPIGTKVRFKKEYDSEQKTAIVKLHGYDEYVRVYDYPFTTKVEYLDGSDEWVKPWSYDIVKSTKSKTRKSKVDKNGQIALFGYTQTEILEVRDTFKTKTNEETQKELKRLFAQLKGKKFTNAETNRKIEVNNISRGKILFGGKTINSKIATALSYLPHLLVYGKLVNESEPKPHHKKFKAISVLNFESKLKIDNKTEYFVITVFKRSENDLKYFIEASSIKKSVSLRKSKSVKKSLLTNELPDKDTKNNSKLSNPTILEELPVERIIIVGNENITPVAVESAQRNNSQIPIFPEVKQEFENIKTLPGKTLEVIKPVEMPKPKSSLIKSMAERKEKRNELGNEIKHFNISGPLADFFGKIEIKPVESVAITLDAPQGAGKTRLLFQAQEMFANGGYRGLFLSLEEHPDSSLILEKQDQYISSQNQNLIDTMGELPNTYEELVKLMDLYDSIYIDSWGKLLKKFPKLNFDYDLRKKLNGKAFFVIFQRTQDGKMRGGSDTAFDGDIITKIEKDVEDYRKNYAFFDKNRYQDRPSHELKFNIYSGELIEFVDFDNAPTETISI